MKCSACKKAEVTRPGHNLCRDCQKKRKAEADELHRRVRSATISHSKFRFFPDEDRNDQRGRQ